MRERSLTIFPTGCRRQARTAGCVTAWGKSQRIHRRRTSAVKVRTRAVSAPERATLFESPVPDAIWRVMNVRVASNMRPFASYDALTICIFIAVPAF